MGPLVSVVMPTYNDEVFIACAIQSVLDQEYKNFELIVINDGSADKTSDIVYSFVQRDPRVKLYTQVNKGVSAARNKGISLAVGEYIAFIDSDDIWLPEKLLLQMSLFQESGDIDFISCYAAIIDKNSNLTGLRTGENLNGEVLSQILSVNGIPCGSTPIVRKSILEKLNGFDEDLKVSEDFDLWVRCAGCCNFKTVLKPLVAYRRSSNRLSSLYREIIDANMKIIFQKNASCLKKELKSQYFDQLLLNVVVLCLLDEDLISAKQFLKEINIKKINLKFIKICVYVLLIESPFKFIFRFLLSKYLLGEYVYKWKKYLKTVNKS